MTRAPDPASPPPAGQRVNLAPAAALPGGVRPASIAVELTPDGTPAGLIIDAGWGTSVNDTRPVFEALGITNPATVEWPDQPGCTRVDIDNSDTFGAPFGRIGIPVTITVDDTPTTEAADDDTRTAEHAAVECAAEHAAGDDAVAADDDGFGR